MNIVFFGSSDFATVSLQVLLTTQHRICCVVTQPDRKKGRGFHLTETPIKKIAREVRLKVYQPYKINLPEAIKLLKDLNPDLFVVIAYGQILSKEILNIPRIFSINLHASLLPKYRGAAPINWAIIKGEKRTGVTVIKLTEEMDAGPIILQKAIDISQEDTAVTLEEKLSGITAELLLDLFAAIENNNFTLTPQETSQITFAPKLKKQNGLINWNDSASNIHNLIRGCTGWPGTFTYYKGKLLKIYKAEVYRLQATGYRLPGEVIEVTKEAIVVATGEDNLIIQELQIEGKRKMRVEEFIAGHKISLGEILGKNT